MELSGHSRSRFSFASFPLYAVHGVLGRTLLVHMLEAGVPSLIAVAFATVAVLVIAAAIPASSNRPADRSARP
jgi:hypothetical protein